MNLLSGCITSERERKLRADINALQLRIQDLERGHSEGTPALKAAEETSSKKLATTTNEVEKMNQDLQRLSGEIDAIKVGVNTGEMPGQEAKEGTVAARLNDLTQRLTTVEQAQLEVVATLDKMSGGKKPESKKSKDDDKTSDATDEDSPKKERAPLKTAKELNDALAKGRLTAVVDDGPKVIKDSKGKDKESAQFAYAEALFKVGKLREAALQYNELVDTYPNSKHIPQAKMRLGDSFRHLGDAATAKLYYEELVEKHAGTPEAAKAKERLAEAASGGKGKKSEAKKGKKGA